MYIKVVNPELKERYVPQLNVIKGDSMVTIRDTKAYLQVVNTTNEERRVYIPTIKVYEFETNKNQIVDLSSNSNSSLNTKSDYLGNSISNSNSNLNSNTNFELLR